MKTNFKISNNINGLRVLSAAKKTALSIAFTAASVAVSAQSSEALKTGYNRVSVGLRASHLYDVYYSGYEQLNNGFSSEDMQGLKGSKTKFDMAFGIDLTYFFSPMFSMDAAFDMGKMSGANSLNYYESDVRFFTLGGNFDLKGPSRTKPYKFVPYIRASIALAQFDVKQMLLEDDGVLGEADNSCFQTGIGLGARYHFSDKLHLNLSSEFVTSYTDKWDGYDYGSGRDYMVKTTLGLRYTFGKQNHIDRAPSWNAIPQAPVIMPAPNAAPSSYTGVNDSINKMRRELDEMKKELTEKLARLDSIKPSETPTALYDTIRVVEKITTTTTVVPKQAEKPVQPSQPKPQPQQQTIVRNYDGNLEELKKMMQIEMHTVEFAKNSALLDDEAKNTLSKVARVMRENPEFKLMLNGYCDQDGSTSLNERLAKQRAQSALNYLVGKGVARERMQIQGFGKRVLVDDENSLRAKTINRRVEFVVE